MYWERHIFILFLFSLLTVSLTPGYAMGGVEESPAAKFLNILSSPVQMAISMQNQISSPVLQQATSQSLAQGTDVQVTLDPNFLPQNEPSIAINPVNTQNMVAGANDYRLVAFGHQAWAGAYSSSDGGKSWSNQLIPGFPGDTTFNALSSFGAASDPALSFDGKGNLYYSGIVFNFRGTTAVAGSVFVAKSTDGGVSYPQIVLAASGTQKVFNDKSFITVDHTNGIFSGRVYVSWTRFTATADIMVSSSGDGGATFSTPVKVSLTNTNQGSVPVVGPSGELYVFWDDLSCTSSATAPCRIMEAKSTNGGLSFTGPIPVSSFIPLPSPLPNSHFRVNNFPAGAVDDVNGNVYVAWADYAAGNADIRFSRSTDGGTTWSAPVKVNDDSTTNDQFFPAVSFSSGRLSIDFYDRRLDSLNHLTNVFYSDSLDGGTTFSTNLRVTDVSSNPDAVLFSGGQSFIGDYIGIAASPTSVHPVWTDLRTVTSSTPNDQNIFTDSLSGHDLALKSLSDSKSVVYQGVSVRPINVTATVQNLGGFTETSLTVSFLENGTLIGSTNITSLAAGSSQNATLAWNTNSLARGHYILSAQVTVVPGEANSTNNQLTDGTVQVRFPGDVDGNGRVNSFDLAILLAAYNSRPGSSNWNPNADINNDGVVNSFDLSILLANYNKVAP